MEALTPTLLLEFNPDTLESVRKQYNLHEREQINKLIDNLEEWINKQDHFVTKSFGKFVD